MFLKLCYIWVENYRNFKNFGVNFSSTEKFNFKPNVGVLTCKSINTVPNHFFENKRILDVMGIIGKNGTGKSNLLELVCSLLKGGETGVDTDFLIIIEKDGRFECHKSTYRTIHVHTDFNIYIIPYKQSIDPLKVVYFSNVFDEREHYFDRKISNLSGNYRYKTSRYSGKKTSVFVKQLQFIRSSFMDSSEIPYPRDISISIRRLNTSQRQKVPLFLFGEEANEFDEYLNKLYKVISKQLPSMEKLREHMVYFLILDFIDLIQNDVKESREFSDDLSKLTNTLFDLLGTKDLTLRNIDVIIREWENWLNYCYEYLINEHPYIHNDDVPDTTSIKGFKDKLNLLGKFNDFIYSIDPRIQVEGSRTRKEEKYIIPFQREANKLEERFYNYFDKDSKFTMNWLGLSSGHKAYLDFFSLLWFELKNIKTENVIVCIDEGDLYLHPKWQGDFFYKVITLIPEFRKVNFQFVLTSHSPFLVSDLPSENLIFLTTGEDEHEIIVADNSDIMTFGGNLGDLYIDAFFMEGSLISRFAAKKIQALVDKINNKKEKLTIDDAKLIDLIGEDLIRLQIKKLLDDLNRR